jgi:hypothetical protein
MLPQTRTFISVTLVLLSSVAWSQRVSLGERFRHLTPEHVWQLVDSIPLRFNAHHTQGMVKVGDDFYLTSVEVTVWPRRFSEKVGKYDRDTGEGIGHLFRFNQQGELLNDLTLGEGSIYHPGGMDFDGKYLWIPVCEYRPFGPSFVYRVEVPSLRTEKMFSFDDAFGALAYEKRSRTLIATNWGSRGWYKWKVKRNGQAVRLGHGLQKNPSFYVDYQHCYDVGDGWMLCSGLKNYATAQSKSGFPLGGLDLVSIEDLRPVHQLPVSLRSASGRVMTTNPSWLEVTQKGIRAYFIPDDDNRAVLYIYEVEL